MARHGAASAPVAECIVTLRPLDAPDKVEEAARLHFEGLQKQVFEELQIDFAALHPSDLHGHAISELSWLAAAGPEKQRSVCFGLLYAFLLNDVDRSVVPGYWDYLSLVRTLDSFHVVVRSLVAFAHRCRALQTDCRNRFLALLSDMVESRWPKAEQILLALQRELYPGVMQQGDDFLLFRLIDLLHACADRDETAPLASNSDETLQATFLWSVRWSSALRRRGPRASAECLQLRPKFAALAKTIWRDSRDQVLGAGPALRWAMIQCQRDPEFEECWQVVLANDAQIVETAFPQACLDAFVSSAKAEQLGFFITDYKERRADKVVGLFLKRHFPPDCDEPEVIASFADCVLWSLSVAAQRKGFTLGDLWERFWTFHGDVSQPAFIFAAAHAPDSHPAQALRGLLQHDADAEGRSARVRDFLARHLPGVAAERLLQRMGSVLQAGSAGEIA